MTLVSMIRALLADGRPVRLAEIYQALPDALEHSIRARIYENLGRDFRRVAKGVYMACANGASCLVVAGDAWEEVRKLPSGSIDALLTDPPYPWLDRVIHQGTTRPRMRWAFARKNIDMALGLELYRVLKRGAYAMIFVPAETANTKVPIDAMIALLARCGFVFRKRLIWDKLTLGMGYSGRARYEGIVLLSRGPARRPCDLSMPDVLAEKAIPPARRIHPTEKPIGLLARLIRFATAAGETVLDCFAGSCGTGVAALSLGRNALLIEKALA